MKKIALALCTAFAFALPVHAQTAAPIDPAATAAVKEMLTAMKFREAMLASFELINKNMPAIMEQSAVAAIEKNATMSDTEKAAKIAQARRDIPKAAAAFSSTFNDPVMLDEIIAETIPLYARHFSAAEIKELAAFYKTPVGAKMLATMPQIMSESMQISQKVVMPRIGAAIEKLTKNK